MEKFDVECLNGNEKWVLYETFFLYKILFELAVICDTHFGSNLNPYQGRCQYDDLWFNFPSPNHSAIHRLDLVVHS